MNIIRPEKLKQGCTIGIAATSGAVEDKEAVERGKKLLENSGYKVVLAENCYDRCRYLAGSDEKRVSELQRLFRAPEIHAIICMRGGYGAVRLINKIDYSIIRQNPKIFCGYSDISALSAVFLKRAGLMTYSGPLIQGDFGAKSPSQFTLDNFFKAVTSDELEFEGGVIYREGEAEGILWGGNLMTIASLCGQDFIPDEPFIFFTEDLDETAYKVDRLMSQLLNIEQFRCNVKGIVLGDFLDIDLSVWLDEIFAEIAESLQIPVTGGFKITHAADKITLPYGAAAKLHGKKLLVNSK
ncbi:MAG: LD-carboxypeptidase [Heliobacteriaceae bacterium]|jgi:muramoyltetrapeptide carboxypeptidase|nr:LD-carboxypeptidase [Heliobacteriaceae bacterium]